jgi:hypothetical protein
MQTTEITRTDWPSFFDSFSRKHEGWLATLEILGPDIGAQVEERELAFEGITDESDEAHGNTIMIMTGGRAEDHVTHTITRPVEVSLEKTDEGADAALAIKSEDGITALLRFRSPALPETVDAMV